MRPGPRKLKQILLFTVAFGVADCETIASLLHRSVRQSSIGTMGFNRRKIIAAWNERQAKRLPMLFSANDRSRGISASIAGAR
ncbi:MAG TPA: hypothetical protein VGU64_03490 [Terriglobales bacterium]|nr:hypothetical protein [Terriglobales bacterium]